MPDREKVMLALNCCASNDLRTCRECPYAMTVNGIKINSSTCVMELASDALDLLREQEARVMTLEELEDWDGAVFFEAFETDMYYALIENVELTAGMDGEYVLVNVVPGEHHRRIWSGEHYGKIWRCWTSRPTPEQLRDTKWEGDSDA